MSIRPNRVLDVIKNNLDDLLATIEYFIAKF